MSAPGEGLYLQKEQERVMVAPGETASSQPHTGSVCHGRQLCG